MVQYAVCFHKDSSCRIHRLNFNSMHASMELSPRCGNSRKASFNILSKHYGPQYIHRREGVDNICQALHSYIHGCAVLGWMIPTQCKLAFVLSV